MRICTTNPGKLREFGALLTPLGLHLQPSDASLDVPETGLTFVDNAKQKALGYADHYPGEWLLAEDSGLVIPALGGMPGPWSARYVWVGKGVNIPDHVPACDRADLDRRNVERVLNEMQGIPAHGRAAYFVACVVIVDPARQFAFVTERRAYGRIGTQPAGSQGFGYDSIFYAPETGAQSWAEIDPARKNLVSPRQKAIWDTMAWLCATQRGVQ